MAGLIDNQSESSITPYLILLSTKKMLKKISKINFKSESFKNYQFIN